MDSKVVLSKAPWISRRDFKVYDLWFNAFSIRQIKWWRAVSVDLPFLQARGLGNKNNCKVCMKLFKKLLVCVSASRSRNHGTETYGTGSPYKARY